jgi:Ca2+-binding RTX toxin-like protein
MDIYGTGNGDTLFDTTANDYILGYGGNDRIYVINGGRDEVYGGSGDDTYIGTN